MNEKIRLYRLVEDFYIVLTGNKEIGTIHQIFDGSWKAAPTGRWWASRAKETKRLAVDYLLSIERSSGW